MTKPTLHRDRDFIVGEEKALNYILALLFIALFIYGLADAVLKKFIHIDYQSIIFALALAPAIFFFRKGRSNRVFLRINKTGIYQDEKLVTYWANFINASLSQEEKVVTIRDNFVLVVEYKRSGTTNGFRRKIPLTNTQNQSEEDILAAVRFFWNEYKRDLGTRN